MKIVKFLVCILAFASISYNVYCQACFVSSLDHYSTNFTAEGGGDLVYLETYPYGCTPNTTIDPDWILLDWWTEGFCYVVCEENTGGPRDGYVLFGDMVFYVSQAAPTDPLSAGTISGPAYVCYNTSPGTLTGTSASGGDCGTNYGYQWEVSTTSPTIGFNNISGATSLNYAAPAQTNTRYYRRKVTCGSESAYSNVRTITAYEPLSAGSITGNQVIMSGTVPAPITSMTSGSGGGVTGTYQWYLSQNSGISWSIISYATGASYSATASLSTTSLYKRKFTSTCGSVYSNTITVMIADMPSLDNNQNYIYTMEPLTAVSDSVSLFSLSYNSVRQSVVYYDGLGRPNQNNLIFGSPDYKDIITPIAYDSYGREAIKYLPFTAEYQFGAYSDTAIISQSGFHNELFPNDIAYAVTVFEDSPLNRVLQQGAPGTVWQPCQHSVRYDYGTNTIADSVILWRVNINDSLLREGDYNQGRLYKTIVKDENWSSGLLHTSEEYKDFQGRVVLKRNYVLDSASNPIRVETYYVYDDFNLLRYVLPPEAINHLGTTAVLTRGSYLIMNWCYYYKYDERKRMTIKQLPGVDPVYIAYDQRDRLVVTQDGNMRQDSSWLFTKYDNLNRPILTGVLKTDCLLSLEQMQDSIDNEYSKVNPRDFYVTRDIENLTHLGYTNSSFPDTIDGDITYYTATYYDDYDYLGSKEFESGFAIVGANHRDMVRGLVTGTKALVLDGGNTYLTTTSYYDDKYRPIQVLRDLYDLNDTIEIVSNNYDFVGQLVETNTAHISEGGTIEVSKYYSYDHMGRLLQVQQEIDENTVTLSKMVYNDLGQLKEKQLHVTGSTALQNVNYDYNIRGWLTAINDPADMGNDLFSMELCYNDSTLIAGLTCRSQYNGNIAGIKWKSTVDANVKGYGFIYDALNRMTDSYYGEGSSFTTFPDRYNESIGGYDLNGNILSLERIGFENNTQMTLDNLTYAYSGNKLNAIIDAASNALGFKDVTNAIDYSYDSIGNMIQDLNKGIVSIEYNYLNLPSEVIKDATHKVLYTYDATGVKLKKRLMAGVDTITDRYYTGAFEYNDLMELDLIYTDEGVVNVSGSTFNYEYFIKDHLGNIRASFKPSGDTLIRMQTVDYYPFGMVAVKTDVESDNKYLYNGKELQDDKLGEVRLEWYDYGARMYDASLARWHCIDPQAERYSSLSPYTYVDNNPMLLIDPNGEEISFSLQYKQDEDGNDIYDDEGNRTLIGVTMHVTGKVINVSDNDVDMDAATAAISSFLESKFQGDMDGVSFKTEANLTVANSMDDVSESDHVFALAEMSEINGDYIPGGASDFGGKVAFIDADLYTGVWDRNVGNTGEREAGHEFGHLANLLHQNSILNLMRFNAGFPGLRMFNMNATIVNSEQLKQIHTSYEQGRLNQGSNSEIYYSYSKGGWQYKKMPNRGRLGNVVKY